MIQEIRDYFSLKAFSETTGTEKVKATGRRKADARNATCRQVAEVLFRERAKVFALAYWRRRMMETRLPAVLYPHYGQHLIVWLWSRALDDSILKRGKNLGQDRATFRRARLLQPLLIDQSPANACGKAGARDKGLIWRFHTAGDFCRLWYCSLE